jgi:hypothetical protein
MIDNQHGCIVIECDSCTETFTGERGEEWSVVWGAATREGWRSKETKLGKWRHTYEECSA